MLTAVLDEMSDKCQRKVASRGVALHDDVFGREADDIHEVVIPRQRGSPHGTTYIHKLYSRVTAFSIPLHAITFLSNV